MAIIAVLIRLTSKGPVLFKQDRVGRNGQIFKIYKFRTMTENATKQGGISISRDPRVTRVGKNLRGTKLDELPQLFNVLKGEMSIIGPRPELPEIVRVYTPEQMQVLTVKPGIIGPAQIIGRNEADMLPDDIVDAQEYYIKYILPDKLEIDLNYVQNSRFLNDIKLLLVGIRETLIGSIRPSSLQDNRGVPPLIWIDTLLMIFSYSLAYMLRFDWIIPETEIKTLIYSLPVVVAIRLVIFIALRMYHTMIKYIGLKDLINVSRATLVSTGVIVIAIFFLGLRVHSRSIFIIDWFLLVVFMMGVRVAFRLLIESQSGKSYRAKRNILVVGAGDIGEMVVREVSRNGAPYQVVGFVDDDPKKIGSSLHGVKVYGECRVIPELSEILHVDEVFIAIGKLSSNEMRVILEYCEKAHVKHCIVPAVSDIVSGRIHLSKIRQVDVSDLLGRNSVELDLAAIQQLIKGKRILVSGAGGSIGSELCTQILHYHPKQLVMVDRCENYLFELQMDLQNHPSSNSNVIYRIADITRSGDIQKLFMVFQPELVFHAAAQKHVPLSESNADQAVLNNVLGTKIMATMSHRFHVKQFVLISTDKAVNPTCVMGATKRIAELLIQGVARNSKTKFNTVRFGNVLNSHGSVIPLFLKQIRTGGPVTVTHPEIKRFFMSIPEAVNLVLQAAILGEQGDTFVLDMGRSVRITDLATDLIHRAGLVAGSDIEIRYSGLRPGEKLEEELVGKHEQSVQTPHQRIHKIVSSQKWNFQTIDQAVKDLCLYAAQGKHIPIVKGLKALVPEYREHEAMLSVPEFARELDDAQKSMIHPWVQTNVAHS